MQIQALLRALYLNKLLFKPFLWNQTIANNVNTDLIMVLTD